MAHSFGSTILARTSAATSPITRSATTAAGDTVLVLMLKTVGATDRTGGAPTFNGVAGVQANSTQKAATTPEAGAELWYWTGSVLSGTGSLFIGTANIVIPNTGSATIFSSAYTGRAASGFTSQFDAANGTNATSTNPTTNAIVSTVNGAIYFAVTAGGWTTFAPSARTGTSLFETDDGADGGGGQYFLQTSAGSQAMTWTFGTSDDWGAVGAAFREVPMPSPAQAALSLTGLAPSVLIGIAIGVGSLGLVGQTPDRATSAALTSPTILIQRGELRFKGPAHLPSGLTIALPAGTIGLSGQPLALAFTVPIAAGGVAATGQAPTAFNDDPTPIAQGTLSLSGQAPTLARTIPIAQGTLALTGQAPQAFSGTGLGTGALALTGQAPTLAFVLPIGAGTLTFVGQAPAATVGTPGTTIAIPAGQLLFKGPARSVDTAIAIPAGSLSLTGQTPFLGAIGLGSGSLTLAGQAPILSLTIPIAKASLALTGQAPTRNVGTTIAIGAGSLSLTGQFVAQIFDGLAPAALTFTGYAPTVAISGQVTRAIGAGSLSLSGQIPSLAFVVPVGSGNLSLSGQAPSLAFVSPIGAGSLALAGTVSTPALTIPIGAVSLTLQGQAPSTGGAITIAIGSGALALTGQSLTANVSSGSAIPAGVLTLAGQAPVLATGVPVGVGVLALTGSSLTRQVDDPTPIGQGALTLAGTSTALLTSVGIPTGSLSLSGQPLSLNGTVVIGIPAGAIGITGRALTLDRAIAIGAGALSLSGRTPVAGQSYLFTIPTGTLTLTGTASETLSLNNVKVLTIRPVNETIYTLVAIGDVYTTRDLPS
jgi:hypothetical protein